MSTGKDIIDPAVRLLSDASNVRWPIAELVDWLNEGVKAVILAKPSASSQSVEIPLIEGTRQTVPSTGTLRPLRIIDVERNVVAPGNIGSQGRMITPIGRDVLDAQQPGWHDNSQVSFSATVKHIVFDEDAPLQFYVYPGNNGTGRISAVMSVLPTPVGLATYDADDTGLVPIYDPVLVDYVLSRAFLKDDLASNPARAQYHAQLFAGALGLKIQVEGATSPNQRRAGS